MSASRERAIYEKWVQQTTDNSEFAAELKAIEGNDGEILDRFYRDLEFGTAGLRGVLGLGTNRMNIYTVRWATQGLANYLCKECKNPSAAIAYDSRINSDLFAKETARVLAANGIKVHLYAELMPTPALSYAVRELGCDTGVVVTASHNPAEYNGYKAYGSDGSQLGPEAAGEVMNNMAATDIFDGVKLTDFDKAVADGMINYIPESFIQQYINRVFEEAVQPEACAKAGLKLVYTPLNGAGYRCVTTILEKAGVTDIAVVKEQRDPDGNFPTCSYPNPETKPALELGIKLCRETGADLLLATDPDADRVGIAVKDGDDYRILTGNEVGVLLLDYLVTARKKVGNLPENPVAVKSIVSTKLADAVAKQHGVEMVNVLTGFKFIGEVILGLEQKNQSDRFVLGFEESCGYLSGGFVRDKDAVNASQLIVEMASVYKLEGKTLIDVLNGIYSTHGIYRDVVDNFTFAGADGMVKMKAIMDGLRTDRLTEIGGVKVAAYTDYNLSVHVEGDVSTPIAMPKSNVLEYEMEDGCTIIIRPSGTEPKIKAYYLLNAKTSGEVDSREKAYREACAKIVG